MLEIDEQIRRMLSLVIERKIKTNKLKQQTCLDNEEDEDIREYENVLINKTHELETKCYCIE